MRSPPAGPASSYHRAGGEGRARTAFAHGPRLGEARNSLPTLKGDAGSRAARPVTLQPVAAWLSLAGPGQALSGMVAGGVPSTGSTESTKAALEVDKAPHPTHPTAWLALAGALLEVPHQGCLRDPGHIHPDDTEPTQRMPMPRHIVPRQRAGGQHATPVPDRQTRTCYAYLFHTQDADDKRGWDKTSSSLYVLSRLSGLVHVTIMHSRKINKI